MPDPTPGRVLRDLQQAQDRMRKARALLREARGGDTGADAALARGWESLQAAHRVMAAIPLSAVDDSVMLRQAAVQRYATALLVRLRRLARGGTVDDGGDGFEDDEA